MRIFYRLTHIYSHIKYIIRFIFLLLIIIYLLFSSNLLASPWLVDEGNIKILLQNSIYLTDISQNFINEKSYINKSIIYKRNLLIKTKKHSQKNKLANSLYQATQLYEILPYIYKIFSTNLYAEYGINNYNTIAMKVALVENYHYIKGKIVGTYVMPLIKYNFYKSKEYIITASMGMIFEYNKIMSNQYYEVGLSLGQSKLLKYLKYFQQYDFYIAPQNYYKIVNILGFESKKGLISSIATEYFHNIGYPHNLDGRTFRTEILLGHRISQHNNLSIYASYFQETSLIDKSTISHGIQIGIEYK